MQRSFSCVLPIPLLLVLILALTLGGCSSDGGGNSKPVSGLYVGGASGVSQPSDENMRIHSGDR